MARDARGEEPCKAAAQDRKCSTTERGRGTDTSAAPAFTKMKPLNGEKTHPLSKHALGVLAEIARKPMTTLDVNAGVISRFKCEALVETVMLPSPYKTHKGGKCPHLQITDAGRKALASRT